MPSSNVLDKMLPTCIRNLIISFLPGPEPYVPPFLKQFDTMGIDDWEDVEDVRAYGDY
jgi:hypothetical protein